jgi:hypothetical protein
MIRRAAIVLAASGCVACATPAPASAGIGSAVCGAAGLLSGVLGKTCSAISGPAGKLLKGLLGSGGGAGAAASRAVGLAAVGAWVIAGARFALRETVKVVGATTSPQLTSTWFSATYWRTTAIAALLTLPFLFAAAIQALMRSDLAMLVRAALGYLPMAILASAIAAPLTMLLLAASDEMSRVISAAAGGTSTLTRSLEIAGVLGAFAKSPFLAFMVGLLGVAGALVLWLELVVREAAVYVVVLMLPLAFAAMVWPARRVWAIRGIEILVALILSKFAMVAVLTLGSAAFSQIGHLGIVAALAGVALLMLGAFAPWVMLRLLPLSELASGAMAPIGRQARAMAERGGSILAQTAGAHAWDEDGASRLEHLTAHMRRDATLASEPAGSVRGGAGPTGRSPDGGGLAGDPDDPLFAPADVGDPADTGASDPSPDGTGAGATGSTERPESGLDAHAVGDPGHAGGTTPEIEPGPPGANGAGAPRRKWQPPSGGLPTITFSPEGLADWPRTWPGREQAGEGDGPRQPRNGPPEPGVPGEDHDPLPPPQDSGDARL